MTTISNSTKKEFPRLQSIDRISKIPVVETGVQYATGMYWKIKNSNALMRWSFTSFEGGIQLAVEKSLVAVPLLEMPLFIVDSIVCKSLDTVEQRVPAINYPPELILNITKDMVSARIVQPAIKRVDSVKQFSVNGATKYTEIAASRLDTALNVAEVYVDKYLPDATDATDNGEVKGERRDSKASQTIEHVNRFSRKLQRRLTKRTIAEAKALKKQGVDVAQFSLYLLDLMVKDPKQFAEKMKAVWAHLSEDEPENQIPPANLEQLIAMLTREVARRFVHMTNYTAVILYQLPSFTVQAFYFTQHHLSHFLDQAIQTVHLEGAKAIAVARARNEVESLQSRIRQFYDLIQLLIDNLGSRIQTQVSSTLIPLEAIPAQTNTNTNHNNVHPETPKKKKGHKSNNHHDKKETKISEEDQNSNNKTAV